ncbi:hypothetical protein BpHYR1_006393 [Brachionus plicatilis]|uniref:Uncharacterized protein n=1 Tax=Brachionus plicatilis TaxID=10195 RepID=A0A3M7SYH8_BRAPC|nr:hypothetical protein BpHYR1_006393 [Brachionus plicatilis]
MHPRRLRSLVRSNRFNSPLSRHIKWRHIAKKIYVSMGSLQPLLRKILKVSHVMWLIRHDIFDQFHFTHLMTNSGHLKKK